MLTLVFAVDSASPGAPLGRQVNVWKDEAGRAFARAFVHQDARRIDWSGLGVFVFTRGARAVTVWPEAGVRPDLIRDMFARVIQPVILQALGWQALHASAVHGPAGVIVFCGLGRSGKSTLAFAGGRVPHHAQVADDAVVLGVAGADVLVHPVPFRPKLRHPALEFFHNAAAPGAEPSLASTAGLTPPLPLRAIVVLSQDAGAAAAPTPVVVPSAAAFSALLRHAHCFDDADPVERRRLVESYLAIAERVPVFRLTYRPDLGGLSSLAATVVRTVSAPRPRPRASRAQLQHV